MLFRAAWYDSAGTNGSQMDDQRNDPLASISESRRQEFLADWTRLQHTMDKVVDINREPLSEADHQELRELIVHMEEFKQKYSADLSWPENNPPTT
jgi:hypothetical protein